MIIIARQHYAERAIGPMLSSVGRSVCPSHRWISQQEAMLSQGEPRDAAIIFDTTASCMRLLWYSMGFLYRPTIVDVQ